MNDFDESTPGEDEAGIPAPDISMPAPDQLATDSLEALRDQELGAGGGASEAAIDPAMAALLETGSLDEADIDLDDALEDELDGFGGTRDVMFDSIDDEDEEEDDDYDD